MRRKARSGLTLEKKNIRRSGSALLGGALLGIALTCGAADTQAPEPAAEKPVAEKPVAEKPAPEPVHIFAGPAEAVAYDRALISEPPGTPSELPHVAADSWTLWEDLGIDRLLRDVRLSDLLIALFAAVVALFAARIGTVTSGIRAAARRQADEGRRVTDAADKAASAARRSAEAAEKMLASMRESTERQLRAYVTVRQFMQSPVKEERGGQGWLLQVTWQNTGATPTRAFRYWAMLREFDRAVPDDFAFTPAGLKDFAGGDLGANSSVSTPPLFVSRELIARMQDGSRKVLLLGQADYGDVLDHESKRETRFCVELVLAGDPGGPNPPFTFAYFPKYNSVS